jgi:lambda repressor-like predicted transcriptional regulator
MKKDNKNHYPKTLIVKALKQKGITIQRITVEGQRTWETSDGNWVADLQELVMMYGLFKTK